MGHFAAGIVTAGEQQKIDDGLRAVDQDIELRKFEWDMSLEDVHMNIETTLTKRIGAVSAKLHTARSRKCFATGRTRPVHARRQFAAEDSGRYSSTRETK